MPDAANKQSNLTYNLSREFREQLKNARYRTWADAAASAVTVEAQIMYRPTIRIDDNGQWRLDFQNAPKIGTVDVRTVNGSADKRDAALSVRFNKFQHVIASDGGTFENGASWAFVTNSGHFRSGVVYSRYQTENGQSSILAEAIALAHAMIYAADALQGEKVLIITDCFSLIQGNDPIKVIKMLARNHPNASVPIRRLERSLRRRRYSIQIAHVRSHCEIETQYPARAWNGLADILVYAAHTGLRNRERELVEYMEAVGLTEIVSQSNPIETTFRLRTDEDVYLY